MRTYFVDFNTMMTDPQERVTIAQEGHDEELPAAREGERVLLTDDTMTVEAVVVLSCFPDGRRIWLGVPEWSTMRDVQPESATPGASA